jgi:hypothetical protein
MGYKKKTSTDKVPPEIVMALKLGKSAYQRHETWPDEPDQMCMAVFLICGVLIRNAGRELWMQHRTVLKQRSDIRTFWAFKEYETRG